MVKQKKKSVATLVTKKKDDFLMEAYSKFTKDTHTLKILYGCRIHLKIITLSDITSADKKKLMKTQLNGNQSPSFMSELVWPKQKRPDKKSWEIFKQVNKYIFCYKTSYKLKKPRKMETN